MATKYIYNDLSGEFEEREIQPPRIKYFRLRNRAFLNSPCTIEWEVENASTASLDRVGPQPLRGFFTYRPNEKHSTWTLRASGEGDNSESLDVDALPLPIVYSFDVISRSDGGSFVIGDTIELKWNAENYETIEIQKEEVFQQPYSFVVDKDETEIKLEAICDVHRDRKTILINAIKRPKLTLTVSRDRVRSNQNEEVILTWEVADATSALLIIGDEEESVSLEGTRTISPNETTQIKLVAIASDNIRKFDVCKEIEVLPEASIVFKASKEFTFPHVPVVISWDVKNAKSVQLIGDFDSAGNVNPQGNLTTEFERSQTIKLHVIDDFGEVESSINIRMLPIPIIKEIITPAPSVARNLDVSVKVNRPTLNTSLPHYPTIRFIPFVPEMNIPQIEVSQRFVSLNKITSEKINQESYWKRLPELTTHIFNHFKKTINNE